MTHAIFQYTERLLFLWNSNLTGCLVFIWQPYNWTQWMNWKEVWSLKIYELVAGKHTEKLSLHRTSKELNQWEKRWDSGLDSGGTLLAILWIPRAKGNTGKKIILKCLIKELSSSAEETQSLETEKTPRVLDLIKKEKHSCR